MPLTAFQRRVIEVLRPFRADHDHVAGGAVLNRGWPRLSDDIDIFHDRRDRLPQSAELEITALRRNGFAVDVTLCNDLTVEAILRESGEETRVQWFSDAEPCRRFYPAIPDTEFGFRLHQSDIAVQKVWCASRRPDAPRDAVDLVNIVRRYAPLGPLVWAAVALAEETTPLVLLREIRRIAFGYADEEVRAVRIEGDETMTRAELRAALAPALDHAIEYCEEIAPLNYEKRLFVDSADIPVEADEADIADGRVRAIPIKNFTVVPKLGAQSNV